jgi:putative addiction module component (TIGR02574 family)
MISKLREIPLEERIQLVEDLWDSIAEEQQVLQLTTEQKAELDRRLDAYELDQNPGRLAANVIKDIRQKL